MIPETIRVFVSSTWLDLKPEREAVEAALQRMRETKYIGMEYFGSRDESSIVASLDEVDLSQLYIGIFGGRYGSGITEQEYCKAYDQGVKCLIYFKNEDCVPPDCFEADTKNVAKLQMLKKKLMRHTITQFSNPDDLAAKVTADIHRWLFDNYFPEHSTAGQCDVVRRWIAVGDHSQFFVKDYHPWSDAYIEPWQVFERIDLEHFVGRKWILSEIDKFLSECDRGYFILEAGAGLGKTAFMAWLVKERGYIHHFCEFPHSVTEIQKSLVSQLVLTQRLIDKKVVPEMAPSSAERYDYIFKVLKKASEKRDPGEKIVIVVDALDEAETPAGGQNVLGLPKVLPEGVYFIISQRSVKVTLDVDGVKTKKHSLHFTATDDDNLKDMNDFLENASTWSGIVHALEESGYCKERFISTLKDKCQGVWIYLHYILPEIEQGERSPLNLDELPAGLNDYYADYWLRWSEKEEWNDLYLPALTTLAAAQEPITLNRLIELAGVRGHTQEQELERTLNLKWRPFLVILGKGANRLYRFYHATVQEFFEGRLEGVLASEEFEIGKLSEATRDRHRQIANRYLIAWGGLEKGLPDLVNHRDLDNGYGLRHLAAHLEASGRAEELHCLLRLETVQGRNLWYEAKEGRGDVAGYLKDRLFAVSCG